MTVSSSNEAYQQCLDELRETRGDAIEDGEIAEVVRSLMQTMKGDVSALDVKIYKELDDLTTYLQDAKSELASIRPDELRGDVIPAAAGELDAIVAATEEATGTILDAAEKLEGVSEKVDDDSAKVISDAVTAIYEACNFQDITGQRVTKVVTTLQHIEGELAKVVALFGDELRRSVQSKNDGAEDGVVADEDLLNGPSLAGQGATQEEIDALLASFD